MLDRNAGADRRRASGGRRDRTALCRGAGRPGRSRADERRRGAPLCRNELSLDRSRLCLLARPQAGAAHRLSDRDAAGRRTLLLDRKSVVEGKSVSVRVDLGSRRISKKTKTTPKKTMT